MTYNQRCGRLRRRLLSLEKKPPYRAYAVVLKARGEILFNVHRPNNSFLRMCALVIIFHASAVKSEAGFYIWKDELGTPGEATPEEVSVLLLQRSFEYKDQTDPTF